MNDKIPEMYKQDLKDLHEEVKAQAEIDEPISELEVLEGKIQEWKKQYKKVYRTELGELTIIWRLMSRKDYTEVMSIAPINEDLIVYERENAICRKVILHPADVDEFIETYAAVAEVIANECMTKSGFDIPTTTEL